MKTRQFVLAALLAGMASSAAYADLHEVKENIKQDSKEAGHATANAAKAVGHGTANAARAVGHGTADAARTVGHGIAHVSREGWEGTKRATKRVFHSDSSGRETQKTVA